MMHRPGLPHLLAVLLAGPLWATPSGFREQIAGAAGIFMILVGLAVLYATTLFLYAFFGPRIRQVARVREQRPLVSFLVGLPVVVVLALLLAVTIDPPATRLLALVLLAISLGALAVGFAGSALEIGRRLLLQEDPTATDLRCLVVGFPVLVLFSCLPIFGWVFGIFYVLGGLGALLISWQRDRGKTTQKGG
jgi:hypothetical protein